MLLQRFAVVSAGIGLLLSVSLLFSQPDDPPAGDGGIFDQTKVENEPAKEEGIEEQGRGPVHEAFANPSSSSAPQAHPVIAKAPPAMIEEMPPDQKPDGDNVQWLCGYWHYDDDKDDHLWVSGLWRQIPPGMDWVPGAWNKVSTGHQWSSGFWKSAQQGELSVVPPPPDPINAAEQPAPNDDSTYVPGCWVYKETRYVWRNSYYMPCRPGWVWVPARYVWSPCGYYFINGYWDYTLRHRGLLFCPVVIHRDHYLRPGFIYHPRYVVHDHALLSCLFVRPNHGSYHFGDYYDAGYSRRGYIAWSSYRVNRVHRDGLYDHYRFVNRGNPAWERNLVSLTALRVRNEAPRPAFTLNLQIQLVNNKKFNANQTRNVVLLAPIARVNRQVVPLVKLDAGAMQDQRLFAKKLNDSSVKRSTLEMGIVKAGAAPKVGDSVKTVALVVPVNRTLPPVATLKTLPPPPKGGKSQIDPTVIGGKTDPPKDKTVTKDKVTLKDKDTVVTKDKDKVTTPKDKTVTKDKVTLPKDTVTPPKDKVTPPKDKVTPPKDKVTPPKDKVTPPKDKVTPPKDKVTPPKDKVTPPKEKIKEAPPKEKVKEAPPKEKVKEKGVFWQDARPRRIHEMVAARIEADRMNRGAVLTRKLG